MGTANKLRKTNNHTDFWAILSLVVVVVVAVGYWIGRG